MCYQLMHFKVDSQASAENYSYFLSKGWRVLQNPDGGGHNDSRLTGGTWIFKGDEETARSAQKIRWEEIKKQSDDYYNQPWI
jgi:hypothetical protein